jgi:hypothetical protein
MKKPTVIMWNHLDYATQSQAMLLLEQLRAVQQDPVMKTALGAAIIELELWSNAPIELTTPAIDFEEDEPEARIKRTIH